MKFRATIFSCILFLLTGCVQPRQADSIPLIARALPLLPSSYHYAYRLDSYTDGVQTSHSHSTAARTEEGFSYATHTGQQWLFLRQDNGLFAYYVLDSSGTLVSNENIQLSAAAVEQLQTALLPLGILSPEEESLSDSGKTSWLGRSCRILTGQSAEEASIQSQRTYYVDLATGVTLYHLIQYTDTDGSVHTYELTCERFTTEAVLLPTLSP